MFVLVSPCDRAFVYASSTNTSQSTALGISGLLFALIVMMDLLRSRHCFAHRSLPRFIHTGLALAIMDEEWTVREFRSACWRSVDKRSSRCARVRLVAPHKYLRMGSFAMRL